MKSNLCYSIARLDRLISQRLNDLLKPLHITLPQYTALSVLSTKNSLSNASLAKRSFITPQSANKIVHELLELGWIERHSDPLHGRRILVSLTDKGREKLTQCNLATQSLEDAMIEGLDIHVVNLVHSSLEKMLSRIKQ